MDRIFWFARISAVSRSFSSKEWSKGGGSSVDDASERHELCLNTHLSPRDEHAQDHARIQKLKARMRAILTGPGDIRATSRSCPRSQRRARRCSTRRSSELLLVHGSVPGRSGRLPVRYDRPTLEPSYPLEIKQVGARVCRRAQGRTGKGPLCTDCRSYDTSSRRQSRSSRCSK